VYSAAGDIGQCRASLFCFALDRLRFCHLGDFGQAALRPEQETAIGEIDVLFIPAGNGPTVGGKSAAQIVRTLRPLLVVPMHLSHRGNQLPRSTGSLPRSPWCAGRAARRTGVRPCNASRPLRANTNRRPPRAPRS
jgi:hypothetical protein